MFNPMQPAFKLRIFGGMPNIDKLKSAHTTISAKGDYIDIEDFCGYPVTYEESADHMTHLNFRVVKDADVLFYYFHIGLHVSLFGGFYTDEGSGMRHIFSGTVTRLQSHFSEDGRMEFSVECMHYGFTKMGKDYKNFVYPDPNSKRKFAQANNLSVMDIVKGIAEDNNLEIGEINVSDGTRTIDFNKLNIRYQKNETDWKFLTKLAQDMGCTVWISTEDGVDKLYFMSKGKAFTKQGDIGFVFPLYGRVDGFTDKETQKSSRPEYNRPRILRDVTIDEDIAQADSISRSAIYFDKETGETREVTAQINEKEGKATITFYDFDESKVAYINKTDPETAEYIRNNPPSNLPWGDPKVPDPRTASYYYKEIQHYDDYNKQCTAAYDHCFFGISVSARCNMDLDIHSQRSYMIHGVMSYHSKNLQSAFYLKGLKHIWDSDGCWTELEFMK